ncbi:MAG: hypothetical protein ACFFBP_00460 [Promethearchaeota archaeon]
MIDIKLYNAFTHECLCLHCSKNRKIINKNGRIKKCISCTRYRNTPNHYVNVCDECDGCGTF